MKSVIFLLYLDVRAYALRFPNTINQLRKFSCSGESLISPTSPIAGRSGAGKVTGPSGPVTSSSAVSSAETSQ